MEVGRISTRVDAIFDDRGFDKFERRIRKARSEKDVDVGLKATTDRKGFDQFDRHSKNVDRSSTRMIGTLGKSGVAFRALGTGAAAGAAGFGLAGQKMVGVASDINESITKNQVLFGKYAKGIDTFSKQAATSIGMTRKSVLEYTGTFGNLFNALGITQKKSAGMSKDLIKLAADMASFNNSSPEEALDAIRSGLVGETEPLRRFGVNMNDATLKTQALSMHLIKNTKESLTPQTKALAANALITKQTAAAHGDFARTSGGLANQQRILKAQFVNTAGELGAKMLPIALKVVKALNTLVGSFGHAGKGAGDFGKKTSGAVNAVRAVFATVFKFIEKILDENRSSIRKVGQNVSTVFSAIGRALSAIGRAFVSTFGSGSGTGKSIREIVHAIASILSAITTVATAVIKRVLPGIVTAFRGFFTIVKGIITTLSGILTGDFGKAWDGVKTIFRGALKIVGGLMRAATAPFRQAASMLGGAIKKGFQSSLNGIVSVAQGFVNGVIKILNKIPGVHIGLLGMNSSDTPSSGKAIPAGGVSGNARVAAFAEGGKVTQPIAIMGEEAPEHPEWVIPTNPAYRGRAVSLWMAAAHEIGIPGFATGGKFSQSEMSALWKRNGGGDASIAGAVGMAESGGDPNIVNSIGATGLWQLHPGGPQFLNPDANARAGIAKWRAGGSNVDARWKPWEAYTGPDGVGNDGPWRAYANGAKGDSILGKIGGAIGSLAGSLLPSLPKLPKGLGFTRPAFANALGKAKDFISEKAGSVAGAVKGALGLGGGSGTMTGTLAKAAQVARAAGLTLGSGYRSPAHNAAVGGVNNSLHTHGTPSNPGAQDLNGPPSALYAGQKYAASHLNLKENLVHDVGSGLHLHLGFFRKGGKHSKAKAILSSKQNRGISRSVARAEKGIGDYEGRIQGYERTYDQMDRRYGLSDEQILIEHDDGSITVDEGAQNHRLTELKNLAAQRKKVKDEIDAYRKKIRETRAALKKAIDRLKAAMAKAKGKSRSKERGKYKTEIEDYEGRRSELLGTYRDLNFDREDQSIDLTELGNEIKEVSGMSGTPATPVTPDETAAPDPPDVGGGGVSDAPVADAAPTPPSAEDIARGVAEQLASFNSSRSELFGSFGGNFVPVGAGMKALDGGVRNFGAFGYGEGGGSEGLKAGGGGGPLVVNNFGAPPPDPHTWTSQQAFELSAL